METKQRISLRLTPYQLQILNELSAALDSPIAVLVRAIIGDFLSKNEETLERIITENKQEDIKKLGL